MWLQIASVTLMLRMCTDMLFTKVGKVLNFHIHWEVLIQMWQGEAFTMGDLYKEWEKRLLLFPSTAFFRSYLFILIHFIIWNKFFYKLLNVLSNLMFSVRMEQGTVTSLLERNGTIKGVEYKTKTGEKHTAYAPLTVVCDGCCSNLRRNLCNPKVKLLC